MSKVLYLSKGFINIAVIICCVMNTGLASSPTDTIPAIINFDASSEGLSVSFANKSKQQSSKLTYRWQFGDGASSTLQNPSHIYAVEGKYRVSLMAIDEQGNTEVVSKSITLIESTLQELVIVQGAHGKN
ncbi:PKD domain-containing protein [Shewanella gaetbuli]